MPTPGYKLSRCKASAQGFNPQILLLTLDTEAPKVLDPDLYRTAEMFFG